MRKTVFVALVALCAAFPGKVCAETNQTSTVTTELAQGEIDDVTLEWVINQVVDQTGLSYSAVRNQYESGILSIEKVISGYEVTLQTSAEGGMGIIIIATEF